jgi:RimJ/RimL family protein N-acetyltransferase
MFESAHAYKEELRTKLIKCWYEEKYKYYFAGEYNELQIGNNTDYRHDFVHINPITKEIDGFLSYNYDMRARSLSGFGLISFSDNGALLMKDTIRHVMHMFENGDIQRVEFWAFADNPVVKQYSRIISKFGGTEVATLHRTNWFDGRYHDCIVYEILEENLIYKSKSHMDEEDTNTENEAADAEWTDWDDCPYPHVKRLLSSFNSIDDPDRANITNYLEELSSLVNDERQYIIDHIKNRQLQLRVAEDLAYLEAIRFVGSDDNG